MTRSAEDDELAEARLLLGHLELEDVQMPEHLKKSILRTGLEATSNIRTSTTKAGVVAIDAPPPVAMRARSMVRIWGGWLVAAACFALAVYQWRARTIETPPASVASQPAPASGALHLRGSAGIASSMTEDGVLVVEHLPATAPGQRYQLWVSQTDASAALPAGAFPCETECVNQRFSVERPAGFASIRSAWILRTTDGPSDRALDLSKVVAQGTIDERR